MRPIQRAVRRALNPISTHLTTTGASRG